MADHRKRRHFVENDTKERLDVDVISTTEENRGGEQRFLSLWGEVCFTLF